MARPKPKLSEYLKTRLKHPLRFSYDLIYTTNSGDRYKEGLSAHTFYINLIAAGLAFVSIMRFNCTVWFYVLCVIIFFILRYLRYFWADFDPLDENGQPVEDQTKYRGSHYVFIALEIILMIGLPITLFNVTHDSPYARPGYNIKHDEDDIYLHYTGQNPSNLLQAYEATLDFGKEGASGAIITDYAVEVSPERNEYYFVVKNLTPSLLFKTCNEFEIMRVWIDREECLTLMHYDYGSPYAKFKPVDPPTAEIDTQKIISIICTSTGMKQTDAKYYYIGTHFLTNLPELADPGGDTWAVQVETDDSLLYYTVNLAEGTAVLEGTTPPYDES